MSTLPHPRNSITPHVRQTSAPVDLAAYARQRSGSRHPGFCEGADEGADEGAEILELRFSQRF